MSDVFTKKKRSEVMSRIRSRGNKDTELALAKVFRKNKITGWRRHVEIRKVESGKAKTKCGARGGPGRRPTRPTVFKVRPDFVFPKLKLAVFVDGCFWHGCPRHATRPKNNRAFWDKKLSGNRTRDALVTRTLRSAGWRVVRVWECRLSKLRMADLPMIGSKLVIADFKPRKNT
jgi:DNA mismatch endonuclease (patch repair protein)